MQQTARRKLKQLDAARMIDELRIPPGNRLETLKGDKKGTDVMASGVPV
jgi:proteic killer suppression protein